MLMPINFKTQLAKFLEIKNVDEIPYLAHAAKKSSYEEREVPPAQLAWLFRSAPNMPSQWLFPSILVEH